jgi:hypothetical protein
VIICYQWQAEGFWQCVCPDTPEVNATSQVNGGAGVDPDGSVCRAYIPDAYNLHIGPDPAVTLDDFEFVEPPPEWVNPNARAGDADVVVFDARDQAG